jgi:hypothetical protein
MKPTLDNIDQWLFDALEGNLSPEQEQMLEEFIAQNPEFEIEQDAWSQTSYSAAPITFEPKSALYRKRQFSYKHFAAAAILLLLLAVKAIFFNQSSPSLAIEKRSNPTRRVSTSVHHASASQQSTTPTSLQSKSTKSIATPTSNTITHPAFISPDFSRINSFNSSSATPLSSAALGASLHGSSLPRPSEQLKLQTLPTEQITGYRTDLNFESLARIASEFKVNSKLRWPALQRLSQFAQKELGLSNNQSYDLLAPGKSNIDANISSIGTLSQLRFQSTSMARSTTENAQTVLGQQFSLDGYSRSMRAGIGVQANYKQYAQGAISDYELGLIAAPKIMISRSLILEPAARLRMGARYATASKLQQLSFIEFENADLRTVQIDTAQAVGRRLFYKDLDLSLAIQTPILFASAQLENAFQHFDYAMGNELNPSNSHAPQLLTVSLGTQYASRNEKMRIAPYVQYRSNRLQTQYLAGLQLNINKWQFGLNIANNKQYQAAIGYFGKHSAVLLQSCQLQLLTLNQPSYYHQVTFRIYSQPSRKARRYIDL